MSKSSRTVRLPARRRVKPADTWDLKPLFPSDKAWEKACIVWATRFDGYKRFQGKLSQGPKVIAQCLELDADLDRAGERLGNYAFLRSCEDQADSIAQRMLGRHRLLVSRLAQAGSWIRPELLAIEPRRMERFLKAPELEPWRIVLERILRYRPHTRSAAEEQMLATLAPITQAPAQAFRQLNDADLKWGLVEDEKHRRIELGHATFSTLLHSPSRPVRKRAFTEYYTQFEAHRNTMAATLNGSVQADVAQARVRGFSSALEAALFPDNVPVAVYDNLVASVRRNLPALYRYFEVRRRKMKLPDLHHYDTYVPILSNLQTRYTWDQAVEVVIDSLAPLGPEYCHVLHEGLTTGRWADRYPNQGKRSGAFSSGGYDGPPYLLMNYQPDVLDQVFTLAHEAGHSMHSWYSVRHQPYQYAQYTIFVAEVASTFNEQLLAHHLMHLASDDRQRAYLINRLIDSIRGTIIRQTMFAEFERLIHARVEADEPLTVDNLRQDYRKLLEAYFGPDFALDPQLELECLRIPHFYSAFYVYKYATGLSAAIALSQRVLQGGRQPQEDYLRFLKSGCSRWSLDLLRDAGVDMARPGPVDTALAYFGKLVDELDALL